MAITCYNVMKSITVFYRLHASIISDGDFIQHISLLKNAYIDDFNSPFVLHVRSDFDKSMQTEEVFRSFSTACTDTSGKALSKKDYAE